jgi:hypothetical protein
MTRPRVRRRRRSPLWMRNHLVNPVVRALTRTPGHRLLGGRLLVLTYTGRRTGRRHEPPVMSAPFGNDLVVVAGAGGKTWWRNFGMDPQEVRMRAGPSAGETPHGGNLTLPGAAEPLT